MTREPEEPEEPEPLFGRTDAATLLAVEGANGGECAGLGQVMVTFEVLFGRWPDDGEFSESCGLLCEAGLIEYVEGGLGLLPRGRKLLRRAGVQGSPNRPEKVSELLGDFEERDLVDEGSVPVPDEADVTAAREALTPDVTRNLERVQASNEARLVGPPMVWPYLHGTGFQMTPHLEAEDEDEAEDPG